MSSAERRMSPMESEPAQENRTQLLEIVWRRKGIVILTTLVGLGLATWYYLEAPKVYRSQAILLIKERETSPVLSRDMQLLERDKMETQLQVITSNAVLARAAEDPELQKIATEALKQPPTPASIATGIKAEVVKNSDVLKLTFDSGGVFQSGDPRHATAVMQAVIRAYDETLRGSYADVGTEAAELIKTASDNLEQKILQKRNEYAEFRTKHAGDLLVIDGKATNVHSKRLADLLVKKSELIKQRLTQESELTLANQATASAATDQSATLDVVSKLNQLTGGAILNKKEVTPVDEKSVAQLNAITDLLLQEIPLRSRFGEDHPAYKELNEKIDLLTKLSEKIEEDRRQYNQTLMETLYKGHALIHIPESPQECAKVYAGLVTRELDRINSELESLEKEIEDARQKSREFDAIVIADENFREGIRQAELLGQQILARLDEINIVKDSGGTRAIQLSPPTPGQQVSPVLLQALVLGGLLGAAAGAGIAYLLDLGEGTFRSPSDVVRGLELQILGQVPSIESRRVKRAAHLTKIPQTIIAAHQPSSSVAEAFRAIRTALYFSGEGKGHQVIQLTSPTPGDGKSTLSANLAVSIAKSGKRVLLIDADFRRPTQHRIFGVSNENGLASYLTAPASQNLEPQETEIQDLFLLPAGPAVSNPSELLSGVRMGEVIEAVRSNYDFVIIDTPPVLAVTDPLAVAARVDGIILAMRISRGIQYSSKRAKEALERVGANLLGVVVNGFARNSTFARGVAKDYGYGHGYGYGYGYSRNPYADPYARRAEEPHTTTAR